MSRVTGKPPTTHWRRPITRTYDYNTNLGENYYKPQLDYIESRRGRGKTPPSATTFAERLLKYPPSGRSSSATRRDQEAEMSSATSRLSSSLAMGREASMGRYSSLDDLGFDEDSASRRRRQLLIAASTENLSDRGPSPLASPGVGGRSRVTFGDKMLESVGVKEGGGSSSLSSSMQQNSSMSSSSKSRQFQSMTEEEGDAIDKILAERRNRRQAGNTLSIQSADADLFTEDPLKSPQISSRLQNARQQMDDMREEMRRDSDASTSRFRQKLRAKREQERREEQDGLFGSMSSLNETSTSALAASAASRRAAARRQADEDFDSDFASSRQAMSAAKSALASSKSAMSSSSSTGMKMSSNISSSAQNLSSFVDDDDAETAAILGKVEQIRKRAKARMAALNDDFPDLQIESSLASRRAATRGRGAEDDFDSDFMSSSASRQAASSTGGRSVTISKRTMASSYDLE